MFLVECALGVWWGVVRKHSLKSRCFVKNKLIGAYWHSIIQMHNNLLLKIK